MGIGSNINYSVFHLFTVSFAALMMVNVAGGGAFVWLEECSKMAIVLT